MRWSSIILSLIGLTSLCVGAPAPISTGMNENLESETRSLDRAASSSSARKLPTNDVGLPSELAWQAWLVVAKKPDAESSFESATVPRRISPKSVFVAPRKQTCRDGYKMDSQQRCVKDIIQFNYEAHLDFLVQRLKANFPSTIQLDDSAAVGSDKKQTAASGPTQVNISLGIEDNWSVSRLPLSGGDIERDIVADDTMEISVVRAPPGSDRKQGTRTEAVVNQPEGGNGTEIGHEVEGTFFRGNNSENFKDHTIREIVVPVAEIVDDANKTFASVIDYEIPPPSVGNLIFNNSQQQSDVNINDTKNVDDSQPAPTVVLLLSANKIAASPPPYGSTQTDRGSVKAVDLEIHLTGKNDTTIDTSASNFTFEDTTTIVKEREEVTTPPVEGYDESMTTEVQNTPPIAEDATDSNYEILDHRGEAGMPISGGKLNSPADVEETLRRGDETAEVTAGGNISSESSISGDVILETTLLDLNTGTTPSQIKLHDPSDTLEADGVSELNPDVVLSTKDSHRPAGKPRTRSTSTKRPENSDDSSPVSLAVDPENDKVTFGDGARETLRYMPVQYEKDGEYNEGHESPSDRGHLQQRRRTTSNRDYVRFPESRHSAPSSYVLFPSDHANSINKNVDYKLERTSFAGDAARPQPVARNSVSHNQKKTYWSLPPGWRFDGIQPTNGQRAAPITNGYRRQNPMLLRFWTTMPLFRDPSLTSNSQSSFNSQAVVATQRESIRGSIDSPDIFSRSVKNTG